MNSHLDFRIHVWLTKIWEGGGKENFTLLVDCFDVPDLPIGSGGQNLNQGVLICAQALQSNQDSKIHKLDEYTPIPTVLQYPDCTSHSVLADYATRPSPS